MTSLLNDAKRTWSAKHNRALQTAGPVADRRSADASLGASPSVKRRAEIWQFARLGSGRRGFYSASLRLREQYDIVVQSNAFKKLAEMPAVQMGIGFGQMTWYAPGGPGEQVRDFFGDAGEQRISWI